MEPRTPPVKVPVIAPAMAPAAAAADGNLSFFILRSAVNNRVTDILWRLRPGPRRAAVMRDRAAMAPACPFDLQVLAVQPHIRGLRPDGWRRSIPFPAKPADDASSG